MDGGMRLPVEQLHRLSLIARDFYASSRHLETFRMENFQQTWAAFIQSGAGVIFANEQDGEIAGALGGVCHRDPNNYDDIVAAELFWFVREQYRGVGISLYREFEAWAQSMGAASIQMVHLSDVMPEKVKAFYLREGYVEAETRYIKKLTIAAPLADPAPLADVEIFDGALLDPKAYREKALALPFRSFEFEKCTFHGIATIDTGSAIPSLITDLFPNAMPTLSFFRKSPQGQKEPHFIHTDADMGDWSAILYLNPEPPAEDGTLFWTHAATGTIGSDIEHERSEEGRTPEGWVMRRAIQAEFNRLVLFPSRLFHSRAIHDNWGSGDGARLTQVTFGRWAA